MKHDDIPEHAERLLSEASQPPVPKMPVKDLLDEWIDYTLITAMASAASDTTKVAAASAGIRWKAVQAKIPPEYGSGFGE